MISTTKIIHKVLPTSMICQTSSKMLSRSELEDIGQADAKKRLIELHDQYKQKNIESQLGRAGIPKRFIKKNFDNYQASTQAQVKNKKIMMAYAERFPRVFENGTCFLMVGNSGTGKTHLAVAVLNEVSKKNYSVIFTSTAEILRRLRGSYGQTDETESDIYELYTAPDLIVIDEVGVAIGDAEKRKAMLFDLINARYNELKPTILIGNLTAAEMEQYLGTRIFDRMKENNGFVLPFEWQSHRNNKQETK